MTAPAATCSNIQFAPGDVVNGPMHTNDQILICGNPTFGRTQNSQGQPVSDAVEVSHNASPGYRNACAGTPNVRPRGQHAEVEHADAEPAAVEHRAEHDRQARVHVHRDDTIRLVGSDDDGHRPRRRERHLADADASPFPTNGVVYVKDGGCGAGAYNAATLQRAARRARSPT